MNSNKEIQNINVDLIIPNRFQPRLTFDENALNELANSIKEHGIIQPLVLRKVNDKYEIIAGERRYKAAQVAGLTEVPAIITDINDNESAEVALVENVQRKNLNSMEEARSYKKILDKGYLTQEALAQKMGISQSSLANKLRLLNLTPEVQEALLTSKISERHARSLLMVSDPARQVSLLNKVISERLTVKALDELIKNDSNEGGNTITPVIEETHTEEVNPFEITSPNMFDVTNNNEESVDNTNKSNQEESIVTDNNIFDSNVNIFDNKGAEIKEEPVEDSSKENQEINENNNNVAVENIFDDLNNTSSVDNEKADQLDTLDTLDEEPVKNDSTSSLNLFNIFNKTVYPSLEDEQTNLSMGEDDYFNPFNNENMTVETPLEEPKKEVTVETPKIIKENDLSSVKKAYDNLKKEIEEAGFRIQAEDFDFEDIYQLIIKIDK